MKFQYMSDLHIAFHSDKRGNPFRLKKKDVTADTLVIAGDIGEYHNSPGFLRDACMLYKDVLYVPGNHEYYGRSMGYVDGVFTDLAEELGNLHYMLNDIVEVDGQRFLGTTLWFPDNVDVQMRKRGFSDFVYITDADNEIFARHEAAVDFLSKEARKGDVVITHHAPSYMSVAPRFAGSPLNVFFAAGVDELLTKEVLWVHGHMHTAVDYENLGSRVVCNPMGYGAREPDTGFDIRATLDPQKYFAEKAEKAQK